MSPQDISYLHW